MRLTLRAARINCGMKQKEVADLLGVNVATVSSWETGKTNPSLDNFRRMCGYYHVPEDWIKIGGEEDDESL